ncbi:MAG: DUF4190 domain-containing protein [Phycisphaerales bacterium]|nr:DUF4190 domain-containing protein [Phycisphaerales bacterium]
MNHAQFDGSAPVEMYAEPERTSIAAILSLVLGILGCCGGITGIIAVLLAIFAIIGIKGSRGRVGGMGLAIAGLLIGLLMAAAWIAVLLGVKGAINGMDKYVTQPTAQIFLDLQSDNFDGVRAGLVSPAADATDEELIAFRDAYTSTLGNYKAKPNGWGEYIDGWMSMGQYLQNYQGRQGMIPIPLYFDNGTALVVLMVNPQKQSSNGQPVAEELIIIDQNGTEYKLPAN